MTAAERTTRRKPYALAPFQTKEGLRLFANYALTRAQQLAFEQGEKDFETSTRDHPPYGFSDLQMAWRAGWLQAEQVKNRE